MFGSRTSDAKRVDALEDAIRRHEKLITALEELLADLQDKHIRLRGRVYATGLHKQPEDESEQPRALDRDALRRRSGFVPGQPMRHKE